MRTIKIVLLEMKLSIENHESKSPMDWINWASELASLWQNLKDEMTKYEMLYKSEEVELIEQGKKISEAERITEAKSENYKMFKYLHSRDKIVEEFIRLAKLRCRLENNFE